MRPVLLFGTTSARTAQAPCCSRPVFSGFFGGSMRLVGFQANPEPQAIRCLPTRMPSTEPHQFCAYAWRIFTLAAPPTRFST